MTRSANRVLMFAAALLCAIPAASAQQYTVLGVEGFVERVTSGPPYILPSWVMPNYNVNAALSGSDFDDKTIISTANGPFYTPQPIGFEAVGSMVDGSGNPVGELGYWNVEFPNTKPTQDNSGLFVAGIPASYNPSAPYEYFVAGNYGGTATAIVRRGYGMAGVEGTVTVSIDFPTSIASPTITLHFVSADGLTSFNVDADSAVSLSASGLNFTGTGYSRGGYVNSQGQGSDVDVSLTGTGHGFFLGQNGQAIGGLIAMYNPTPVDGVPAEQIAFAVAFNACKDRKVC